LLDSRFNWQGVSETGTAGNSGDRLYAHHASESAIVVPLAPGNYTAILSGKNITTGNAPVEAYGLN